MATRRMSIRKNIYDITNALQLTDKRYRETMARTLERSSKDQNPKWLSTLQAQPTVQIYFDLNP
jgi:hypothetical protein